MERFYPVLPLEGAAFPQRDGETTLSLTQVAELLNDPSRVDEALDALGISVEGTRLLITFTEHGKAYEDPEGDRTKTEDEESRLVVTVEMALPQELPRPLPLKVHLGGWLQEQVNFLGRIEAHGCYSIPLTGRGTAALEGRSADAHAGYCTGGSCASFQERAALVLAVALAAGASAMDLHRTVDELERIDARFHGRRPVLLYTLHCCLLPEASAGPYTNFYADLAAHDGLPVSDVMAPLLAGDEDAAPGDAYFTKLAQKFSAEEMAAAEGRVLQAHSSASASPTKAAAAVEAKLYPLRPLPGAPIPVYDANGIAWQSLGVDELGQLLNGDAQSQWDCVQALGFFVGADSIVSFQFREEGRAYADPHGDRSRLEAEDSERVVSRRFELKRPPVTGQLLPIRVDFSSQTQDEVNFLGYVEVRLPRGERYVLPLTGRGTAALEGRSNDAHAGFCTGGACASFQNRVALCLAIGRALVLGDDEIELLGREFHSINSRYHGRTDILDYTIHCALVPGAETYRGFMLRRYSSPIGRPPVLRSLLSSGQPNTGYFEALAKKFSATELDEERKRQSNPPPWMPSPAMPAAPVPAPMPSSPKPKSRLLSPEIVDLRQAPGVVEQAQDKSEDRPNRLLQILGKVAVGVSAVGGIVIIIVYFSLRK